MTITNGYCSLPDLKSVGRVESADDDPFLETCISAASRTIDRWCGRSHGFWQDSTVQTRDYTPDDSGSVYTDDISTATGLIVKTDTAIDGTFATTLTITTDFLLYPRNADKETPVRPWSLIRVASGSSQTFPVAARPTVQVTAKFGWPAVPDEVKLAAILQASMLYSSKDARNSITADGYLVRPSRFMHPQAELLLADFRRAIM